MMLFVSKRKNYVSMNAPRGPEQKSVSLLATVLRHDECTQVACESRSRAEIKQLSRALAIPILAVDIDITDERKLRSHFTSTPTSSRSASVLGLRSSKSSHLLLPLNSIQDLGQTPLGARGPTSQPANSIFRSLLALYDLFSRCGPHRWDADVCILGGLA
jgi:hypothetical protein